MVVQACMILFPLAVLGSSLPATPPVTKVSSIAAGMQWVGTAVDDPEYFVWCTSPIEGLDGKIHLFVSRMPKKYGLCWHTYSEVAHYVGDRPEGPFRFANIAIPCQPDAPWNNSIHNPAIARVGDKYVLLYITFDRRKESPWLEGDKPGRGKMYTCMAVADSPDGPWKLMGKDGMIIEPSTDPNHWTFQTWSMENPTFLAHGGKYYIYFKAGKHQRDLRYGYAVADKLEGPYRVSDGPCTDNIAYIEDATAFEWAGKFHLLTTDNYGIHTGIKGAGILWTSDTPTDFKVANASIGFLLTGDYYKGDMSKARGLYNNYFKFERPGILMMGGKPSYFYAPSGVNLDGGDRTCSYVLKIDLDHDHRPAPKTDHGN